MPKIVSNNSCLIVLDNINALDILHKLYQNIYLTEEVAQEFGKPLESLMTVVTVIDKNYLRIKAKQQQIISSVADMFTQLKSKL
jgi:predicted nucleic acid-binding protein